MSALRSMGMQIVLLPVAWLGMLYYQQDSMIYMPKRYEGPLAAATSLEGFEIEQLGFDSQDDGPQAALFVRPVEGEVLRIYAVFGGNAMVARDWLDVLSQVGELPRGVAFVLVDYPGYGSNAGAPMTMSIKRTSELALREAERALEAVEDSDESGDVDRSSRKRPLLGAIGHSIGCAAALELAISRQHSEGEDPLKHVVISAPFTSIVEMAGVLLPVLRYVPPGLLKFLTQRHDWDNNAALQRLAGPKAPRVDIIHGRNDEICPHHMGEKLGELLTELDFPTAAEAFVSVEGVGHNDILGQDAYRSWLGQALATNLE